MTFDDALEHPGPLLAAWDLTLWNSQRTLTLFSLVEGRALSSPTAALLRMRRTPRRHRSVREGSMSASTTAAAALSG